jgi:hypothetical protein
MDGGDLFDFSANQGTGEVDLDLDIEEVIRQQLAALEEVTVRYLVKLKWGKDRANTNRQMGAY